MTLLVTGATGMIGSELCQRLELQDIPFLTLTRNPSSSSQNQIFWDPEKEVIDSDELKEISSVVHLAGESIGKRWSKSLKKRIRNSREQGTLLLCETLSRNSPPPKTLISASAIAVYGSSPSQAFTESSPLGQGFLADVVQCWEESCQPLKATNTRVIHMRMGLVLSHSGGVLAKMLPFFKLGLGGILGSGNQIMSWIAMEDLIRLILFFLDQEDHKGIYNAVSPNPVSNAEFTAILGWILKRPTLFPAPAPALRIVFGEMATETMLASTRVVSERLMNSGFQFHYPVLEDALKFILGKTSTQRDPSH